MIKSFILLALFGPLSLAANLPNTECQKRPNGVIFFTHACTRKNVCRNGQLTSVPYDCGNNACCRGSNENMACQCRPGYYWAANKKDCEVDSTICKTNAPQGAWYIDNCTFTTVCIDGLRYVEEAKCPKNTRCGVNKEMTGGLDCVCDKGFVLSETTWECEDPKECQKRPANTWFYDIDCTRKKICRSGKLYSEVFRAGENSMCTKDAKGNDDYVCKPGYTWARNKKDCVSDHSMCKNLREGYTFLTDNCTLINVCLEGERISNDYKCDPNAHCGTDKNGLMNCLCNEGFTPDERESNKCHPNLNEDFCKNRKDSIAYITDNCSSINVCLDGEHFKDDYKCDPTRIVAPSMDIWLVCATRDLLRMRKITQSVILQFEYYA
ncbi:hypothetical protein L596_010166 [Steinernema carpocapsae]|uniref:EGF-like domain-containing protein n=1 Tax=Steinernema carpocapsae TaxID=34508 RepID=A0A4U5PHR2_STECR|nr:hypothetical protein L596_010166 [Steinernema carpocapsae]